MIGTDGDDLGANLHETGEENGVLADPMHLANETDTGSLCDGEFGKIQKVGVADMDIHIASGGLQQYVRAEWRGLGIFRVAQYRALQGYVVGHVVRTGGALGGNGICARPLREYGNGACGKAQHSHRQYGHNSMRSLK